MKLQEMHSSNDKPKVKPSDILKKVTDSIDPIEIVLLFFQKWLIIVISIVVFTALAYFYAKSADYIYRAIAQVEAFQLKDPSSVTEYDRVEKSKNRHILIMSGKMLHKELIAKLRVKWKGILEEEDLRVPFSVKGSRVGIIDLSVDSKNPEYALDYLQGILGSYRAYRERERNQINENALLGLRSEEKKVQSELAQIKTEIKEFELENQILLAQVREQMQSESIANLLGRLQSIKTERLILEYQYKEIADADMENIKETLKMNPNFQMREFMLNQENQEQSNISAVNPSAANLASNENNAQTILSWEEQKNLLVALENQYQQKLSVFKTEHPKMIELKEQINALSLSLEKRVELELNRFQARHQALKRKEESIEKVIERLQNEDFLTIDRKNEYLLLKNKEKHFQNKYDLVYKRILENTEALDNFSFITLQEPYVKSTPIAPNKLQLFAIGPFIGFIFGVAFILFRWFVIPILIFILKEIRTIYKTSYAPVKS